MDDINDFLAESNLEVNLLETTSMLTGDDSFSKRFASTLKGLKSEIVTLENGAEAMLVRSGTLDKTKKQPMLTILHGGPFAATSYHLCNSAILNNFFLM